MGAAILAAIESGLGLIESLASEFLQGFNTLIWDATANEGAGAITTFGTFAFVMLGIGVSFAVIKLVLNLLRGNTGA